MRGKGWGVTAEASASYGRSTSVGKTSFKAKTSSSATKATDVEAHYTQFIRVRNLVFRSPLYIRVLYERMFSRHH